MFHKPTSMCIYWKQAWWGCLDSAKRRRVPSWPAQPQRPHKHAKDGASPYLAWPGLMAKAPGVVLTDAATVTWLGRSGVCVRLEGPPPHPWEPLPSEYPHAWVRARHCASRDAWDTVTPTVLPSLLVLYWKISRKKTWCGISRGDNRQNGDWQNLQKKKWSVSLL